MSNSNPRNRRRAVRLQAMQGVTGPSAGGCCPRSNHTPSRAEVGVGKRAARRSTRSRHAHRRRTVDIGGAVLPASMSNAAVGVSSHRGLNTCEGHPESLPAQETAQTGG